VFQTFAKFHRALKSAIACSRLATEVFYCNGIELPLTLRLFAILLLQAIWEKKAAAVRDLCATQGARELMPELLTDPAHWHLRAQEARRLAQKLEDPEAKAAKHEMADKYERLAARATEWMNKTEDIPRFLKSAPPTAP
jgi:hypothetical protein